MQFYILNSVHRVSVLTYTNGKEALNFVKFHERVFLWMNFMKV